MTDKKNQYNKDDLIEIFRKLLSKLNEVIKEIKPNFNIYNTKLGKLESFLGKIDESASIHDKSKAIEILVRFNLLNELFNKDNNIEYNKKDLIKIIGGKYDLKKDSDDRYNDTFFELSMGLQFYKALKGVCSKIDLSSTCDIVIDNKIAIECKYIHSISNLEKNISKAKNQINNRVKDKKAIFGFVALDFSNILPIEKINIFILSEFENFIKNHKDMVKVLMDYQFAKRIESYISKEMECILYKNIGTSYIMGENVFAIIYQSIYTFYFEYQDESIPVPMRISSYLINESLEQNKKEDVVSLIHSLGTGI